MLTPAGRFPTGIEARRSFAPPNAEGSDWSTLRWDWIGQAVRQIQRRTPRDYPLAAEEVHDLTMTVALSVVEQLRAGVPARTAYNRAQGMGESAQVGDRVCGLTGDSRYLRAVRTERGGAAPAVNPWVQEHHGRRLTPGDWRALRVFLRRHLPDPLGGRRATARLVLDSLLSGEESLGTLSDKLHLSPGAVASARSKAILAVRYALGQSDRRTYDRRLDLESFTRGPATRGGVVQP